MERGVRAWEKWLERERTGEAGMGDDVPHRGAEAVRGMSARGSSTGDGGGPTGPSGLLDVLNVASVVLDTDGRIALWSPQAEELFGYSAAEALGRYAARVMVTAARRRGGEAVRGGHGDRPELGGGVPRPAQGRQHRPGGVPQHAAHGRPRATSTPWDRRRPDDGARWNRPGPVHRWSTSPPSAWPCWTPTCATSWSTRRWSASTACRPPATSDARARGLPSPDADTLESALARCSHGVNRWSTVPRGPPPGRPPA